ncbi:MAG: hypothetical protein NTU47_04140 [Ignavibacteriales bacterium]|nr:hypothetical protein [Ignavibacteriales bacterium]
MGKQEARPEIPITIFTVEGSNLKRLAPVLKDGLGKLAKYFPKGTGILKPILFGYLQRALEGSRITLSKMKGLSEQEIRENNDLAFQELSVLYDKVLRAVDILQDSPQAMQDLHNKLDNIQKSLDVFGRMYQAVYQTPPQRALLPEKKEYTTAELSKMFVQYVIKESNPTPSQSEMAKHYGIGQSTWSRWHNEPEFWTQIQADAEASLSKIEETKNVLFHLHSIAAKKDTVLKFQRRKDKELSYDPHVLERGQLEKRPEEKKKKSTLLAQPESIPTMAELEETLIEKEMAELVSIAQRSAPDFDPSRLQKMNKEQLIVCIVALSYK